MYPGPKVKRFFWSVMAVMSTLMVIGQAFLLDGCNTYQKAQRKYSTSVIDTTFVTDTVVVPRDSVALHVVTDTTNIIREIRKDRARIVFKRNRKLTTVEAYCDTLVITKKIPVYVNKQVWGVDPKVAERYRKQAEEYQAESEGRLRTIHWLIGAIVVLVVAAVIYYLLTKRYRVAMSITRRADASRTTAE